MTKARSAFIAVLVCCAASAAFALPASAATTLSFSPSTSADPSTAIQCFWGHPLAAGVPVTTFGQTITAPANETKLDDFSFHVLEARDPITQLPLGSDTITYQAYVYEWDGSKVGAQVWESAPQTLTTTTEPQQITAATGGVSVVPGGQYALLFSFAEAFELVPTDAQGCFMNAQGWDPYTGGQWLFTIDGGDESLWTTSDVWHAGSNDLAFTATFSTPAPLPDPDPEPEPIYAFDGFYAPVNNKDEQGNYVLNSVNAGRAIPVKFSLGGDYGLDVFAENFPKSQVIECDSQAEVDGVEETVTAGQSSLSYSAGSDTYHYVWKTEKAWEDSCRQLVVKFDDGTTARANFKFH